MKEIIKTPAAKAFLKQMSHDDKATMLIVECILEEDNPTHRRCRSRGLGR